MTHFVHQSPCLRLVVVVAALRNPCRSPFQWALVEHWESVRRSGESQSYPMNGMSLHPSPSEKLFLSPSWQTKTRGKQTGYVSKMNGSSYPKLVPPSGGFSCSKLLGMRDLLTLQNMHKCKGKPRVKGWRGEG